MSARSLERAIVTMVCFLGPLDEAVIREVLRLAKRPCRPRAIARAIARAERRGWVARVSPAREGSP
jgi:hypothetical protein